MSLLHSVLAPLGSTTPISQLGTWSNDATNMIADGSNSLSSHELKCEQFDMPIDKLVNLWLAKYGNEWVDVGTVLNDNYYKYIYKRLKALSELEQHYLTDRSKFVCRKPD